MCAGLAELALDPRPEGKASPSLAQGLQVAKRRWNRAGGKEGQIAGGPIGWLAQGVSGVEADDL